MCRFNPPLFPQSFLYPQTFVIASNNNVYVLVFEYGIVKQINFETAVSSLNFKHLESLQTKI